MNNEVPRVIITVIIRRNFVLVFQSCLDNFQVVIAIISLVGFFKAHNCSLHSYGFTVVVDKKKKYEYRPCLSYGGFSFHFFTKRNK